MYVIKFVVDTCILLPLNKTIMKKMLFFLLSAVVSMAVSAQPVQMKKNNPLPQMDKKEMLGKTRHVVNAPHVDFSVSAKRNAPRMAGAVVTPPEGLETEKYVMNAYMFDGSSWELENRSLTIGFDGEDVYLQGFSVYMPEAWIKGTYSVDDATVTFPMQYYGNAYGEDLYFFPVTPVGEEGYEIIDAVFNYNEEVGTLVLSQDVVCYIMENAYEDELGWYIQYDSEITIAPAGETVVVPEDLETQYYMLTGVYMGYDDDGNWFEGDPLIGAAKVGFDGDDIYVQGLCSYLPTAWVKGHREGDSYVFDNGQYFGTFIYLGDAYPLYFMGCTPETNDAEQFVLTLDPETGALVAQQWYAISSSAEDVYWYDLLGNVVLKPIPDVATTPATPSVLFFENYPEDGMGYVMLDVPVVDVNGEPILQDLLGYEIFCDYGNGPEPYIFWSDIYGFDDDWTTVPYTYNDDMNILKGGELLIVYYIGEDLVNIGVRSVYQGGGETNYSEISWYYTDEDPTSVTAITADDNHAIEYYDLMGRRVDATKLTRGIYVTSDGRKILVK